MEVKIAVLGGDGIGPEVTAESMKVLEAIASRYGHKFDWGTGAVGGNAIDDYGSALPKATEDVVLASDAVLFGAVGGPKWDDPAAKTRPEDGILALRKSLGLFANLRPVKVYPELISASPLRPELLEGVDLIIVRELTGGLYFGKPKKRWNTSRGRRAVDTLKYTEQEIARVLRVGFELARNRRKRLHSLDKMNVLESSRLWREVAIEIGEEYPDIELIHMLADNAAMQLVVRPAEFDVVVAENMFGDILSDEASVLAGSMGMLPSASLSSLPPADGKPKRVVVDEGVVHLQNAPAELGELDERLRRLHRIGERLLDEDVLPRLQRRLGQGEVGGDRRADGDGIDVGRVEDFAELPGGAHRRIEARERLQSGGVDVADDPQVRPRQRDEIADDVRAPVPAADHADADHFEPITFAMAFSKP